MHKREICQTFTDFHFGSWVVGNDSSFCEPIAVDPATDDDTPNQDHAFDLNAVPEPVDEDAIADDYGGDSLPTDLVLG